VSPPDKSVEFRKFEAICRAKNYPPLTPPQMATLMAMLMDPIGTAVTIH
jgi:hypothetical protein